MGSLSWGHWLIVLAVVLVLFGGGGKISSLMGDMARGIKTFKKNIADDEPVTPSQQNAGGHISGPATQQRDANFTESSQPSGHNVK
ncbi:twin-arginine translocase TatA/TatE family subunit [Novacetimonas cocois]|uniref:Sec-independent protein translocase protein TatA n=1 Tax=Novacetimonas cocois TaxID=1747507 RepID=A0A365YZQ6_9PROT|nr:twin-arginine translocase TatA/TatE family subunit [Novacetimonas cocois]RBM08630.1 twin-arginine translocase TatA/TatE family subunit [Novacetimonas cocois]